MKKIKDYVEQITEGQVLLTDVQLVQFEQYYDRLIEKCLPIQVTGKSRRRVGAVDSWGNMRRKLGL